MRRASKIDDNQRQIAKALRAIGCEVVSTAAMGAGFPDLLVYHKANEKMVMLEVKDGNKPPSKRRLTPHQVKFHQRWPVAVVTNETEALEAVGA